MKAATPAWSGSVAIAVRDMHFTEHDLAGRRIVSEHGVIPGVTAEACHQAEEFSACLAAEHFASTIGYEGRTQSGAPVNTRTHVAQSRLQLFALRRWTSTVDLAGGIEWQRSDRDIRGSGIALGLNERYAGLRMLAGLQHHAEFMQARMVTRGLLVLAEPERINIGFPMQLYDSAEVRSKPAAGVRLGVAMAQQGGVSIGLEFDWMRVRRSADYPLRHAGNVVGTVAQPEHVQRLLTLALRYAY
ncbi:hypothetical protein [Noviherbaspirillum humi]|uniref:hypothetical protein n=1 Tax=Noviherbaspirillum humi TaxID=1688639 RepID=UPI0011604F89|nr:hypothetical protein [Noviherbaspirillum humi]